MASNLYVSILFACEGFVSEISGLTAPEMVPFLRSNLIFSTGDLSGRLVSQMVDYHNARLSRLLT